MTPTCDACDARTALDELTLRALKVQERLEEAGLTLLALPGGSGAQTRRSTWWPDVVREISQSYGWEAGKMRPATPSACQISRMEEAYGWLNLIPPDQSNVRRVLGMRSMIDPISSRYLFTWRAVGKALSVTHSTAQAWHTKGLVLIAKKIVSA